MTSAPVVNGMDFMVTPRTDNMQTHKADEQFAGSLRKAVEKGKPEAAEKTGIGVNMISRVAQGKRTQTHGYIFKKI